MKEWNQIVQQMIDWIEAHPEEHKILEPLSREVGYSPWYCSVLFHEVTNMTLKAYASQRRLARVSEALRDTKIRILDLAIQYGYSSQEAFSRVFKEHYGCTPAAYRKAPIPIPLRNYKIVVFPMEKEQRSEPMETSRLAIRVEHIPAHKYLGIWEVQADNYCDFWNFHDCDEVCGLITSMDKMAHPIVSAHTAGWRNAQGKRFYFYGTGVALDYDGLIPEGFDLQSFPASDYLVFSYPSYDFMSENGEVMAAVEKLAWNYDPSAMGYEWNEEDCQIYQRHYPETFGYQVLRPVRKLDATKKD